MIGPDGFTRLTPPTVDHEECRARADRDRNNLEAQLRLDLAYERARADMAEGMAAEADEARHIAEAERDEYERRWEEDARPAFAALNADRASREVEVLPIPATGNGTKSHNTDDTFLKVSGGEGNLDSDTAEVHLRIYSPNSDYQFAQAWFRLADVENALRQVSS